MIIKTLSIKLNYVLNLTRLMLNIIVVAITMPYISRILGSESIGKVEYAFAIIEYFILFSALGIPIYGIRQIAQKRDSLIERSKVVIELAIILSVTTTIAYILLFLFLNLPFNSPDIPRLILYLSIGIFLSNMGFEWFYQGIENQLFITVRHIFVKIVSVVVLYCFVKSTTDIFYYALFLIISNYGVTLFNILYLKKYIVLGKDIFLNLNLKRHLKPAITIFIASASVSIYMQLDKIMLGAMVSEEAVGFYSQAMKLPRMMILLVTSIGAVMLPRLSHLLEKGNNTDYKYYMNKSFKYILFLAIPATLVFVLLSKEIILIMAGDKFIPSITTMIIISPIIFIVSVAYYIGFLVLYPRGKEYGYTVAVSIAAVVNFIFNYCTLSFLKQDGAALGTLIAEFAGVLIMIYFARKELKPIGFFDRDNSKYFISGGIMAMVIYMISFLNLSVWMHLSVALISGFCIYGITLMVLKDIISLELWRFVVSYKKKL